MESVALMTIFQVPNYGSVLQTYATQLLLENKLGYKCDVINYRYPNEWHYNNGFRKPTTIDRIKTYMVENLKFVGTNAYAVNRFRNKYLNLTKTFKNLEELEGFNWSKYHAVIAGSDQIWNYNYLKGDSAFMLSFVADNVKKISVASSFATSHIEPQYRELYRRYLSRFSFLSTREENGLDVISKDLKLEIQPSLILDPTLLISANEWNSELKLEKLRKRGKYLLLYILDYAFQPRPFILEAARSIAIKMGCESILTLSASNTPEVMELGAKRIVNPSVEEFVELFKEATAVVTSSFHGTAFAVNFGRPLISVVPSNKDDRQSSLLKLLGISQCAVSPDCSVEDLSPMYDVESVLTRLNEIRHDNVEKLKEALK